jgi:tetratricopeptide (TPR) repeat protein
MARVRLIKHNPRFLSDAELLSNFVVRLPELDLLLKIIGENTGPTNQHIIVIGPRGMGKTMLVRRLALAVRIDLLLGGSWYPVSLPEDIYVIANEGELWLQVLKQVANQEKSIRGEFERWSDRYQALSTGKDDQKLRIQCLSALSEFASERKKRLLVCVENLQMLFEQTSSDVPWDLRKTLLHNQEIMLVATAVTHFDEITNVNKANYELFREITLKPLSTDDCQRLWKSITNEELDNNRIRPMEILAGGSPRLLATLASFASGKPLSQLMDDLVEYIDDNTTYFKANVEALPNLERRVFVTLAEIWEPVEARKVAERARLDVNTASAILKKLVLKGAVLEAGKIGRKNLYQVVERLYNIYHLMRLSGAESERLKKLIQFMIPLYGPISLANRLAQEACHLDGDNRLAFIEGYRDILTLSSDEGTRELILRETPMPFFALPQTKDLAEARSSVFWSRLKTSVEGHDYMSTLNLIDSELATSIDYSGTDEDILSNIAALFINKAIALGKLERYEEAISLYDEVVKRFGESDRPELQEKVAGALYNKAIALGKLERYEEAISLYDEVVKRFGESDRPELQEKVAGALNSRAWIACLKRDFSIIEGAIQDATRAIGLSPSNIIRHTFACLLGMASRWEEAFEQAKSFVDDDDILKNYPQDVINFFVEAAAAGQAEGALHTIKDTKAESAMEPLSVALKILTNIPFRAPQEVIEVAKDVVKKIEKRAKELKEEKVLKTAPS